MDGGLLGQAKNFDLWQFIWKSIAALRWAFHQLAPQSVEILLVKLAVGGITKKNTQEEKHTFWQGTHISKYTPFDSMLHKSDTVTSTIRTGPSLADAGPGVRLGRPPRPISIVCGGGGQLHRLKYAPEYAHTILVTTRTVCSPSRM